MQFELELPSDDKRNMEPAYFTVELASLSLMPTTVNMFLSAVSKGLWDDAHFSMNAQHVVLGEPTDMRNFLKEGVAQLPFQEHSPSFPHVPYTLGLAGKPSGPSFYINKIDNTYSHGPARQSDGDAEPCFAHVIIGKETIDRMVEEPSHDENPNAFANPIKIVSARIMKLRDVHGGHEYLESDDSSDE